MNFQILENFNGSLTVKKGKTKRTTSERGYNCCRKVFIFDDFVVKFAGNDDYEQNENELRFYNEILQKQDRKHFAKILGSGEQNGEVFIIQERVVDTGEEATKKQMAQFERLSEKYNLGDIDFGYLDRRNCALTSKGIKIFDVGFVQNEIYNSYSW